jgi:ABC-type Fe3+/spermidine/putrescine transport system ATPase subunit
MDDKRSILKVIDLRKTYKVGKVEVPAPEASTWNCFGEFVSIMGPSGCGKSTFCI